MLIPLPLILVAAIGISVEGVSVIVGPEEVYAAERFVEQEPFFVNPNDLARRKREGPVQVHAHQNEPFRILLSKLARVGKRRADMEAMFRPTLDKRPPVRPAPDVFAYTDVCKHAKGACWCHEGGSDDDSATTPCTWPTDCKCATRVTCGPTQPPIKYDDKWCNPGVTPGRPKPTYRGDTCPPSSAVPFCTTTQYTPCATFTPPCVHPTPVTQETCKCAMMTCPPTTKCCIAEEDEDMNRQKLREEQEQKVLSSMVELKQEPKSSDTAAAANKTPTEIKVQEDQKIKEAKEIHETKVMAKETDSSQKGDIKPKEFSESKDNEAKVKQNFREDEKLKDSIKENKPMGKSEKESAIEARKKAQSGVKHKMRIANNSDDVETVAEEIRNPVEEKKQSEVPQDQASQAQALNEDNIDEENLVRLVRSPLYRVPQFYLVSSA